MSKTLHTLCRRRLAALYLQVARHEQIDQLWSTQCGNLAYAEQSSNDSEHVTRQQIADPISEI